MSLRGSACAVAEQDDGRLRWTTLRSEPPVSVRPTATGLTLVASAFGPLGGDSTRVDVRLGAGVELAIGTAGAQVAQPGVHDVVSTARVELSAEEGARLSWRPGPLVVTSGARHDQRLAVRLAAGSRAVLVETAVLAEGARWRSSWRVAYAGVPLLDSDLDVGAGAPPGWDGAAVLGGARVVVSALVVGPDLRVPDVAGGEAMRLAGPAVLLSWLGHDTVAAERATRLFLDGSTPDPVPERARLLP